MMRCGAYASRGAHSYSDHNTRSQKQFSPSANEAAKARLQRGRRSCSAQPRRNQLVNVSDASANEHGASANEHGAPTCERDASPCDHEAWRPQAARNQAVRRRSPCCHSPARSPKTRRAQQAQLQAGQRGRDDNCAGAAAARTDIAAGGEKPMGSSGDCGRDAEAARQADGQATHPDAARRGACACRFCSWRFDSDDESDCERPCSAQDSPRFRPQPVQCGWQEAAETGVRGAALGGAELGRMALGGKKCESGGGRVEGEGAGGGCGDEEGLWMGGRGIYPAGRFVGSDGECVVLAGWDGCCVLLDSSTLQQRASFRPPPGVQLGEPAACHVVAVPSHDGLTARLLLATSRLHAAFCCWDLLSSRLVSCFPPPNPTASPSPSLAPSPAPSPALSPVRSPESSPANSHVPSGTRTRTGAAAALGDGAAAAPATSIHMRGEPSAPFPPAAASPPAPTATAANCPPLSSPCPSSHPSPVCHMPFACCPSSSPRQPPPHHSTCRSHSPPHATSPLPHAPLPTVPPVLPASPAPAASPTAAAPKPAGAQETATGTATAQGEVRAPQARPSAMPSPPSPAPFHHGSALAALPHTDVAGHGCGRLASGHGALQVAGCRFRGSAVEQASTECASAGEHAERRCVAEERSLELHSRAAHQCCPLQPAPIHGRLTQQHTAAAPSGKAGGSDVRIWDVRDGGVAVSMQTEGAVERMACCAPLLWLDEERLVVVEEGGSVGLWHVAGGEAVLFHHVQLLDPWGEAERVCAVAVMPGRRCNKRLFPSLSVLPLTAASIAAAPHPVLVFLIAFPPCCHALLSACLSHGVTVTWLHGMAGGARG
ncbi:unnamed protein product [Closterium sp. Yama58-4]|nr:unnamed protein product [Closterium sp. Yama58-4]